MAGERVHNERTESTMNVSARHFAIVGTWATWFFWLGMVKAFAVLLPTLTEQLQTHTWVIGWMVVILDAVADILGPIAAPLGRRFGVRTCVIVSGLIIGAMFIAASYSSTFVTITLLVLLAGPPIGLSNILCRELIGLHSGPKNPATAYAISQTGGSTAYLVFPPLALLLLNTYGWRGTLLLLGAVCCNLSVCGALLRSPPTADKVHAGEAAGYAPLPGMSEEGPANQIAEDAAGETRGRETHTCSAIRAAWKDLNTGLLWDVAYWPVALTFIVCRFAHTAWLVYFVPHTQSKGLSAADAVSLTAIAGVARLLSGICLGPLSDMLQANVFLTGVAVTFLILYYFVEPWLVSYWLNVISVVIYGCCITVIFGLIDATMCEVIGSDRLGSAFGWMSMKSGVLRLSLLYLPGLIYDRTGSYTLAFMLLGGWHFFAIAALLLLVWLKRRK